MKQQADNFNDFIVEKAQYKVVIYKARHAAVMDIYFRGHRETAIKFLNETFEIIQNNKELTQTMTGNIKKALEVLRFNFPKYDWIDDNLILNALKEDYDETRS